MARHTLIPDPVGNDPQTDKYYTFMIKGTGDYLTVYDDEIKLRGLQAQADRKRQSFKAFRLQINPDKDVVYAFQNAETNKYLNRNLHENVRCSHDSLDRVKFFEEWRVAGNNENGFTLESKIGDVWCTIRRALPGAIWEDLSIQNKADWPAVKFEIKEIKL
jgi:hypothetical protein